MSYHLKLKSSLREGGGPVFTVTVFDRTVYLCRRVLITNMAGIKFIDQAFLLVNHGAF